MKEERKKYDEKQISNKKLVKISSALCLLPILIGIILWNLLPESLNTYLTMYFSVGYISKQNVVFLLPFLFLFFNFIAIFKTDWLNVTRKTFVSKKRYWYMPIFSNIYFAIIFIINIRRI